MKTTAKTGKQPTPEPKLETERLSVEVPTLVAGMVKLAARLDGDDVEHWLRRAIFARVETDLDNITHEFEKFADGNWRPSKGGAK